MRNLVIKTAYKTIKTALLDWALDNHEESDFSNYVYGVTELTDALLEELNKMKSEEIMD